MQTTKTLSCLPLLRYRVVSERLRLLDERYRATKDKDACLVFVNAYVQLLSLASFLMLNCIQSDNPEKLSETMVIELACTSGTVMMLL